MSGYLGQSVFKTIVVLFVAVIVLVACALPVVQSVPPTVKIGLVAPFEGLYRPLGYEALFGVKLALQERNQGDGLHGFRVELVALNDFNDPAEAQIQARALVADPDVLGVVGHLASEPTLAAIPVYQDTGLAVSIPWTVTASSLGANSSGVVTVAASQSETAARLVAVAKAMGFNELVELKDSDITSISDQAEALDLVMDGVTAGETILALHQAENSLPLFGQVDVGSSQLIQVAETAANGLVFVSPAPGTTDVSRAETFNEAYQDLAGFPPGPRAVLAYDATHVLLDAIAQALENSNGRPNRSAVSAVITSIQRQGLTGNIVFDSQGQRINAPMWVYQISDEQYPGVLLAVE